MTSNPSIFEKAILGSERLRRRARGDGARAARRAGDLRPARDPRRPARRRRALRRASRGERPRRLRLARGRTDLAHDTERTLESRALLLEGRRPPERDDQDPGHARGRAGDRAGDLRGDQHQRHAAVRGRGLRGGRRGLPPRARAPPRGGPVAVDVNSVASFFVSRVDTNVDKQARGARPLRARRHGRARQRPRRLPPLQADLSRRAVGGAASSAGAAVQRPLWASTGTKNPALLRHQVRRRAGRAATPSTRCRWRRCSRSPTTARSPAPRPSTIRPPISTALAAAGIDMDQVTDELLVDGVKQFEDAMARLLAGIDERRAAVVTGLPPTIHAKLGPELEGPVAERDQAGDQREGRAASVASRRLAVGAGGDSRDRGPARLADGLRDDARAGPGVARVRRSAPRTGLHRRGAAGDGRLFARSRGDPPLVRGDPRRPAPPRARLHPPRRGARRAGVAQPRADALHRLLQVGRHARDAFALPPLQGACAPRAVRRGHRPRQPAGAARRARTGCGTRS